MSNHKRYGFPDCECDATDEFYMEDKGMCELLDGGFVKWEDYAALKAENDLLRKDRELLFASHKTALADIQRLHWELLTAKEGKPKS